MKQPLPIQDFLLMCLEWFLLMSIVVIKFRSVMGENDISEWVCLSS